jgi:hypothetical protein
VFDVDAKLDPALKARMEAKIGVTMEPSSSYTVSVQPIGTSAPTVIAKAGLKPCRVEMTNVGPILLYASVEVQEVSTNPPGASTYRVLPNANRVEVLAPKQTLYGVCPGVGGSVSVFLSEAIPFDAVR